jgi:hypothetical protein
LFLGGVAFAQQGLVVEPWRKAAAPVATPATPRASPASGLPPASAALPQPRKLEATPSVAPPVEASETKWSPPVVELLVDPWSKPEAVANPPRPRWVPQPSEIVDPWADAAPEPPRVASRPVDLDMPHSPIF